MEIGVGHEHENEYRHGLGHRHGLGKIDEDMETWMRKWRHGQWYGDMGMETWRNEHRNMNMETDMETWTWWHRHGDMDMETWKYGHGHMDMETRSWRHGHGGHGHGDMDMEEMDMETWTWRTWTWRHGSKMLGNSLALQKKIQRKKEVHAIFLNLFSICSSCKRKSIVCPLIDEETNGLQPDIRTKRTCPSVGTSRQYTQTFKTLTVQHTQIVSKSNSEQRRGKVIFL